MKKTNKLGILTLALVLGLGTLTGCNSSKEKKDTTESKVSTKDILKKAVKGMEKVESFHLDYTYNEDITIKPKSGSKEQLISNLELAVDQDLDNEAAHGEGTFQLEKDGDEEEGDVEFYAFEEDGDLVRYMTLDGDDWEKEDVDVVGLDFEEMIEVLESVEGLKQKDDGKINKEKTAVYTGTIDGDTLEQLLEVKDTVVGGMSAVEFDDDDFKKAKVSVRLEVYKDSGMLANLEVDLKDFVQDSLEKSAKKDKDKSKITVDDYKVGLTFSDYDDVDEIEIPDDLEESGKGSSSGLSGEGKTTCTLTESGMDINIILEPTADGKVDKMIYEYSMEQAGLSLLSAEDKKTIEDEVKKEFANSKGVTLEFSYDDDLFTMRMILEIQTLENLPDKYFSGLDGSLVALKYTKVSLFIESLELMGATCSEE